MSERILNDVYGNKLIVRGNGLIQLMMKGSLPVIVGTISVNGEELCVSIDSNDNTTASVLKEYGLGVCIAAIGKAVKIIKIVDEKTGTIYFCDRKYFCDKSSRYVDESYRGLDVMSFLPISDWQIVNFKHVDPSIVEFKEKSVRLMFKQSLRMFCFIVMKGYSKDEFDLLNKSLPIVTIDDLNCSKKTAENVLAINKIFQSTAYMETDFYERKENSESKT